MPGNRLIHRGARADDAQPHGLPIFQLQIQQLRMHDMPHDFSVHRLATFDKCQDDESLNVGLRHFGIRHEWQFVGTGNPDHPHCVLPTFRQNVPGHLDHRIHEGLIEISGNDTQTRLRHWALSSVTWSLIA